MRPPGMLKVQDRAHSRRQELVTARLRRAKDFRPHLIFSLARSTRKPQNQQDLDMAAFS